LFVPPNFDPGLGFPEAQEIAATLKSALEKARPGRIVYLSTPTPRIRMLDGFNEGWIEFENGAGCSQKGRGRSEDRAAIARRT
jgi:hypothetical protein